VSTVADWNDEELLAALQQALAARQEVPAEFVAAGQSAFAWHNIDAELAQLTYDSVRDTEPLVATRSEPASIRALTFTSARLTIELEVTSDSLVGQIVPVQAATIEIQGRAGAPVPVAADEIGCFLIHPIPRGPFRLRCRLSDGADVLTDWLTL
jgi:hypothetical protein